MKTHFCDALKEFKKESDLVGLWQIVARVQENKSSGCVAVSYIRLSLARSFAPSAISIRRSRIDPMN
jgi:hypothetical protein